MLFRSLSRLRQGARLGSQSLCDPRGPCGRRPLRRDRIGGVDSGRQTIPYLAMYPDGICKVAQRKYSKSIAFEDINYQLAQADDKTAIFENWCDFLNYFDASVNVQLSFINQGSQQEQAARAIHIPPDRKSTRLNSSHITRSRMPSSA